MQRQIISITLLLLCLALSFQACKRSKWRPVYKATTTTAGERALFPFFLSEKTMIINCEQNNETEGTYLKVEEVINDSVYRVNLPDDFYLFGKNVSDWMIGWPTGKPYYDAGNENLREILAINTKDKTITIGNLLRGNGMPMQNQRLVFWSRNPSGFKNTGAGKVIDPRWWGSFNGSSIEFGSILFDSANTQWVMYLQEVDTKLVNIYAATSTDFVNWKPYNNGKPFFTPANFTHTIWAGVADDGITPQTARLYSAIFHKGLWYFFLSGYNKNGLRQIGLITAPDPLKGPFKIYEEPIVLSYPPYGCTAKGSFYPKVCKSSNRFLMYYDGIDEKGIENLNMAESEDLVHWKLYDKNPVLENHHGWRSGLYTSEPNYVHCSGDSVWVMIGGYKKYNTEFDKDDSIYNRLPLDKSIFSAAETEKGRHISGNVMDAQLGVFLSVNGGYNFKPHTNNPVWINNYSDTLQNDHIGGDFFRHGKFILYQAKSENEKRYNILIREK